MTTSADCRPAGRTPPAPPALTARAALAPALQQLRRRTGRCLGAVVLAATVCGCDTSIAADQSRIESLSHITASEELRIGSVGDPRIGFSRLGAVDVGPEGNIFVVENSVPEIRVYSPDGALLRSFGRRGDGPGEFQSLNAFGVKGDTVWAVDSAHRRITLFNRRGALLSTGPIEQAGVQLTNGTAFSYPVLMRADGTLTGRLSVLSYSGGDPSIVSGPSDLIPVPHVRFAASGEVIDTIGWAARPPPRLWRPAAEDAGEWASVELAGRKHYVPMPPPTIPEYVQLVDGYILVDRPLPMSEEDGLFTVTRFGLAGDSVYSRDVHYTPSRYSSAQLDTIAVRGTRGIGLPFSSPGGSAPTIENPDAVTNRLRAAMDFPEFQMPIETAWAGGEGSVWIAYQLTLSDTTTWVLLDPDGSTRGRLDLPSSTRLLWHRGDTLFASVPDDLDVPWLVRYTLNDVD